MKKICLLGPVDKRPIAYPLIKSMMFLGRTLIITDDGVYRRFSEDYLTRFGFANSEFVVTPDINEEVVSQIEESSGSFDFLLYITTNEIPSNCDKIVYCHGVEKSFASSSMLRQLENIEHTEVWVTFSKVGDSSAVKIEPSKAIMGYIFDCEEQKDFLATADSSYSTMLHTFFEKELDVPKATLKGLLQRKG